MQGHLCICGLYSGCCEVHFEWVRTFLSNLILKTNFKHFIVYSTSSISCEAHPDFGSQRYVDDYCYQTLPFIQIVNSSKPILLSLLTGSYGDFPKIHVTLYRYLYLVLVLFGLSFLIPVLFWRKYRKPIINACEGKHEDFLVK